MTFSSESLYDTIQYYEGLLKGWKNPGQCQFDFSMSLDQSMWCLQSYHQVLADIQKSAIPCIVWGSLGPPWLTTLRGGIPHLKLGKVQRTSVCRVHGQKWGIYISPFSTTRLREHHKRRSRKIAKARAHKNCYEIVSSGNDTSIALLNVQQLWLSAQDSHKIKSVQIPAWMEGTETYTHTWGVIDSR